MRRIDDRALCMQPGISSLEVGLYIPVSKGRWSHVEVIVDAVPKFVFVDVENEMTDIDAALG